MHTDKQVPASLISTGRYLQLITRAPPLAKEVWKVRPVGGDKSTQRTRAARLVARTQADGMPRLFLATLAPRTRASRV